MGNISIMKKLNKSFFKTLFFPHGLIVIGFALIALAFYYPLLSGDQLLQSDIIQYQGMSKELNDTREATGKETYWVDNAFGGMPTYQIGAKYPADFLTPIHQIIRILPRPAHLLFLYFFSFYLLLIILKVRWYTALFGAFAYGFSTYLLIILQVGHNTKAMALAYMPLVFSGVLLLFQDKKIAGIALTTIALSLQIRANHYQMTYYMLLLLAVFIVVKIYNAFKEKKLQLFSTRFLLLISAAILALGFNATPILATAEYSAFSTRGATELQRNADGSPKEQSSGLDYDYITEYSYGIFESIGLVAPRVQGGGSRENLGKESDIYEFLTQQGVPQNQALEFSKNVPTYWGMQPILEAPAYIGISVVFFALIGLFIVRGKLKYWLLIGSLFALFLSWGKNFPALTNFFIDYFPLYNKFRAVSSIQVILAFCLPVLAALGIHSLFQSKKEVVPLILRIGGGLLGFLLLVLFSKGMLSFSGVSDPYLKEGYGAVLFAEIIAARKVIFTQDLVRAIVFSIILLGIVVGYLYQKINKRLTITALILIVLVDLIGISNRYIDRSRFVSGRQIQQAFQMTPADQAILQDTTRYRVYEPRLGLTGARTSYFHKALGGYHGAKPRRFEELFTYYTTHQISGILDMLNVKYLLYEGEEGLQPMRNPNALGNAWFVDSLVMVKDTDAVLEGLKTLDVKKEALLIASKTNNDFPRNFTPDSTATIDLIASSPGKLNYTSNSLHDQLVVFSEIFYPKGWVLTIDGVVTPILNVNYVLRAAYLPKGSHELEMSFQPPVVRLGTQIRWGSLLLFILMMVGLIYQNKLKASKE